MNKESKRWFIDNGYNPLSKSHRIIRSGIYSDEVTRKLKGTEKIKLSELPEILDKEIYKLLNYHMPKAIFFDGPLRIRQKINNVISTTTEMNQVLISGEKRTFNSYLNFRSLLNEIRGNFHKIKTDMELSSNSTHLDYLIDSHTKLQLDDYSDFVSLGDKSDVCKFTLIKKDSYQSHIFLEKHPDTKVYLLEGVGTHGTLFWNYACLEAGLEFEGYTAEDKKSGIKFEFERINSGNWISIEFPEEIHPEKLKLLEERFGASGESRYSKRKWKLSLCHTSSEGTTSFLKSVLDNCS